jgi:hypothetical protein
MSFLYSLVGVVLLLAGLAGGLLIFFVTEMLRVEMSNAEAAGWAAPCIAAGLLGLYLILFK